MRFNWSVTFAAGLVVLASGCKESDPTLPAEANDAIIFGRVAETLGGTSASTVAILGLDTEGEVVPITEDSPDGSGFYRLESVPTGRDDLAVHALSEGGGTVGSVLVQERSRQGRTLTVAPIDIETTLEYRVLGEVDPAGPAGRNLGGLMAFVRGSGQVAEIIANSPEQVIALADSWVASEGALTGTFGRLGLSLDLEARTALSVEAASDYAELRHAGVSSASAHPLFTADVLEALASAGASDIDLVVATAAAGTAAMHTSAAPAPATELMTVRQVALVNLQARVRLVFEALDTEGATETLLVLQNARAVVDAASTPGGVVVAMDAAAAEASEVLEDLFLGFASGLNATQRLRIRIAVEDALAEADLSARLVGRENATQIIPIVDDYVADVQEAAADAVFQLPVSIQAGQFARILVAAAGGGWLGG